jgi:transcriptional regulator with XRE-family HTH domain
MSEPLAHESNNVDHKDGISDRQAAAFGARLRKRAHDLDLTATELGKKAGIKKQTMTGYWTGERLCGSDKLFALADALDLDPRWLIEGVHSPQRQLVEAGAAEWVSLPRYDLSRFTIEGKPEPLDSMPVRRDWLNRLLLVSTDLWLTEMPSDALPDLARQGDTIICRDVEPREPDLIEGRAYIFMLDGTPIVRRVGFQPGRLILTSTDPAIPPITIERSNPPHIDEHLVPVARVLGTFKLNPA